MTWLARNAAESAAGRAIARALAVTYGIGVVLALWGTLFGPFNALGWIAVALNLLLGSGFAVFQLIEGVRDALHVGRGGDSGKGRPAHPA